VLIWSEFRHFETRPQDFLAFGRSVALRLRSKPEAELPFQEWLMLGNVAAVQFYISDSSRVQFAYVLDAIRPLHLAVSVPHWAWQREVHAVESMLGSIHKVP
jgi:hypothetical protein